MTLHPVGSFRLRASAAIAAVALVLTMFVLVQQRADASPAGGSVAASVASSGAGAAQISIAQIACPILISVRNSFASSPFFSFVAAAVNPLIALFGCSPS